MQFIMAKKLKCKFIYKRTVHVHNTYIHMTEILFMGMLYWIKNNANVLAQYVSWYSSYTEICFFVVSV